MIPFKILHPDATPDHLGLIPLFLFETDPRPAAQQFDEHYSFGGGWHPMAGWSLQAGGGLKYSGDDDPLIPLAEATLRDEIIRVYDCGWVAIFQPDGTFEVSRMD